MIKQTITSTLLLLFFCILSSGYAAQIFLRGRIVDNDNKPVQQASVKLVGAKKSQQSDWDGKFSFDMSYTNVIQKVTELNTISFYNGLLSFNLASSTQKVVVELYTTKGLRVNRVVHTVAEKGTHTLAIIPENLPTTMYFLKIQIGNRSSIFKVLNLKNRTYSLPDKNLHFENTLFKQAAAHAKIIDTLEISKNGFLSTKIDIRNYGTDLSTIKLVSKNSNDNGLPPITNGKSAKTTRYWDCCKPHCGWHSDMRMCDMNGQTLNDRGAKSGCEGGPAFQCWDYAPMAINSKVAYGWAAFNNSGTKCGDCFQLDFEGVLDGKQMIVQVINIGDGGNDAFDLLIPGGGVGAFNGCSRQWNNPPLGKQYGGFHGTCGDKPDCIRNMCKQAFGDKKDLMSGCEWYLGWFEMSNNPKVKYMKVSCPQRIKDISRIGN